MGKDAKIKAITKERRNDEWQVSFPKMRGHVSNSISDRSLRRIIGRTRAE